MVAGFCDALDTVYAVPVDVISDRHVLHLRVEPPRNNQSRLVHWASDYELGAIAQLGERRHGMAEVVGSSPTSSTGSKAA